MTGEERRPPPSGIQIIYLLEQTLQNRISFLYDDGTGFYNDGRRYATATFGAMMIRRRRLTRLWTSGRLFYADLRTVFVWKWPGQAISHIGSISDRIGILPYSH